MRRSCFVPAGSCTRNDTELPSSMTGSRQRRLPLVLRLHVGEARDRLHRRLVFADDGLGIKQHARFLLGGDAG